jgi:hypothetical protein
MAPGKPGSPNNGRPVGANHTTQVRAAVLRDEAGAGQKNDPVKGLLYKFKWWMQRVAAFQGELGRLQQQPGAVDTPDGKRQAKDLYAQIERALDKACEAAKEAAPYCRPRFSAVAVTGGLTHDFDLSNLSDIELKAFESVLLKIGASSGVAEPRIGARGNGETEH